MLSWVLCCFLLLLLLLMLSEEGGVRERSLIVRVVMNWIWSNHASWKKAPTSRVLEFNWNREIWWNRCIEKWMERRMLIVTNAPCVVGGGDEEGGVRERSLILWKLMFFLECRREEVVKRGASGSDRCLWELWMNFLNTSMIIPWPNWTQNSACGSLLRRSIRIDELEASETSSSPGGLVYGAHPGGRGGTGPGGTTTFPLSSFPTKGIEPGAKGNTRPLDFP